MYGHMILERVPSFKDVCWNSFQQRLVHYFSLEGIPYASLMSSIASFNNYTVFCDAGNNLLMGFFVVSCYSCPHSYLLFAPQSCSERSKVSQRIKTSGMCSIFKLVDPWATILVGFSSRENFQKVNLYHPSSCSCFIF